MTRQSKNYSHIWDNVMGHSNHHKQHHYSSRDTTGSSISIVDYSREEITVHSNTANRNPSQPRHYPQYPPKVIFVGKSKKSEAGRSDRKKAVKEGYVSSWDRECAPQPKQLAPWTYRTEQRPVYDTHASSRAFDEYTRRLAAKKQKLSEQLDVVVANKKQKKTQVTINEAATEIVQMDDVPRTRNTKLGQKMNISTQRNDEIKIDAYCKQKTTVIMESGAEDDDVVKIQKPLRQPGFYGTIEAEKCAERVAGHVAAATEHLERLKFVAEAVIPQSGEHLKNLQHIGNDIKEFNSQMRSHRVQVPRSTGLNQVAHFVITESFAD